MGGGLLVGLSHKDAARFAFLLATPIIGAAALLKLPELARLAGGRNPRPGARRLALRGRRSAYLAVRFLMRYFETRTLIPFAIWCVAFGARLHDLLPRQARPVSKAARASRGFRHLPFPARLAPRRPR